MFGGWKFKKQEWNKRRKKDREEEKRKTETYIRLQAEGLAEEMNLRLICHLGGRNTFWVDSVTVTMLVFPPDNKKRLKNKKSG